MKGGEREKEACPSGLLRRPSESFFVSSASLPVVSPAPFDPRPPPRRPPRRGLAKRMSGFWILSARVIRVSWRLPRRLPLTVAQNQANRRNRWTIFRPPPLPSSAPSCPCAYVPCDGSGKMRRRDYPHRLAGGCSGPERRTERVFAFLLCSAKSCVIQCGKTKEQSDDRNAHSSCPRTGP